MWVKGYAVEVKVEVVWMDEVFAKTLTLLTGQFFVVRPVLLPRRHSEEVQSTGYIQGLFSLYP